MRFTFIPGDIVSCYVDYRQLVDLANRAEGLHGEVVVVDMHTLRWYDANMCSPLGAILHRIRATGNQVSIINMAPSMEAIFRKNGFMEEFGGTRTTDWYDTTIAYRSFNIGDSPAFTSYVQTGFQGKHMPDMSSGLEKRFFESIFELFSNAVIHSETELGIFACGQFFPQKDRLQFSITDLGIGFRENINRKRSLDLTAIQAIRWALEGDNTTRNGRVPGGLGLKLLRRFITMNQGSLEIISDRAYLRLTSQGIEENIFRSPFPGTVVNISINTADRNSYCLAEEVVKPEDIFS